jgi:hypothetical protein
VPELDGWGVNGYRAPATAVFLLIYLALRYRGDCRAICGRSSPRRCCAWPAFFGVGSTLYVTA